MKSLYFFRKVVTFILIPAILISMPGCMYFYKVEKTYNVTANDLNKRIERFKYVVVHDNLNVWHVTTFDTKNDTLYGEIAPLGYDRWDYLSSHRKNYKRYKHKDQRVLDERHIYVKDSLIYIDSNSVLIPISQISHLSSHVKAPGRTALSWISPVAIPVFAFAGILIITSCPFIYIESGNEYSLTGEIYSGAILPALERHDYLELPEVSGSNYAALADNRIKLKIANELKECQHTNLAELLIITHPSQSKAYIDKYGNILTTTGENHPESAITAGGHVFSNQVMEKDLDCFLFNEANNKSSVNELILTFNNPENLKTAKLVVTAKNSVWADFAYDKFYGLMGSYYPKWVAQQNKLDRQKLTRQMLEQDVPLSVYLQTDKGWKFLDFFQVTGAVAARDMALTLDLSEAVISPDNSIQLKLVSGFMFWELDYAAIDYSDNLQVTTSTIKAESAVDEKGNDVLASLAEDDDKYLVQPDIGNTVLIEYGTGGNNMQVSNSMHVRVFLHSKGYYEKNPDYPGNPEWMKLMALRHKHSFSEFSYTQYMKILDESGLYSSK